jgi:hypothetical protein
MIEPLDVVLFAARSGLVISAAIAKQAFVAVDRGPLEVTERARFEAKVWDGKSDPPLDKPERWLHGKDGSSLSAIEALAVPNGVVYFLFKDGNLTCWQPHRADKAGHIHMVNDPEHEDHWEKGAAAHIDREVEKEVDTQVLRLALSKSLDMHEAQGVPYGGTTTQPGA